MIQLKDVLHYYIGCRVVVGTDEGTVIEYKDEVITFMTDEPDEDDDIFFKAALSETSVCLRRISSLTDDEKVKWLDLTWTNETGNTREWKLLVINGWIYNIITEGEAMSLSPASFNYLLSIGIDLFQLIDTHQAIVHIDK